MQKVDNGMMFYDKDRQYHFPYTNLTMEEYNRLAKNFVGQWTCYHCSVNWMTAVDVLTFNVDKKMVTKTDRADNAQTGKQKSDELNSRNINGSD